MEQLVIARSERRSVSSLFLRSGAALASAVALVAAVQILTGDASDTSRPWGGPTPAGLALSKQLLGGLATASPPSSLAARTTELPSDDHLSLLRGFQASFAEAPSMDADAIKDLSDYMTYATVDLGLPVTAEMVVQTINYPDEDAFMEQVSASVL